MPLYLCLVFGTDQQALAAETFEAPNDLMASLRTTRFSRAFPWTVRCQLWRDGDIVLEILTSSNRACRREARPVIGRMAITVRDTKQPV